MDYLQQQYRINSFFTPPSQHLRIDSYSHQVIDVPHTAVDEEVIQLDKVFKDTCFSQRLTDLQVSCTGSETESTELQLSSAGNISSADVEDDRGEATLFEDLCKRVRKCEDSMMEKEKEMLLLRQENEELKKQFEREIGILSLQNDSLQNNVDCYGNQLAQLKQFVSEADVASIRKQVEEMKRILHHNRQSSMNNAVSKLEQYVVKVTDEIQMMKSQLDGPLIKTCEELNMSSLQGTTSEKVTDVVSSHEEGEEGEEPLSDWQKVVGTEIANLKSHVTNIENLLFCDVSYDCDNVMLQWKLQNYQHHFIVGKNIHSPIFYTQIKGYCFKMSVEWSGKQKENIGLFLWICRASDYTEDVEAFNMEYKLEVIGKNGKCLSRRVPYSCIEANRENNFTLEAGEEEARGGFGFRKFLTTGDVENYVINDMLTIVCTLSIPVNNVDNCLK